MYEPERLVNAFFPFCMASLFLKYLKSQNEDPSQILAAVQADLNSDVKHMA